MMGSRRGGIMLGSAVEGGEPVYPTMGLNDRLGAIGLLVAILSALFARERSGEGQLVRDAPSGGWAVNLQRWAISYTANTEDAAPGRPSPLREKDEPNTDGNVYQLKDGSWTALGMSDPPGQVLAGSLRCPGRSRPRGRPAVRPTQ